MTIDIHPHVISTDTERYPNAPVGGHKSDWSRERPVSMEQMIAAMDQAGIAKSVLVQASTCYGHDNSYMADAVAAYPNRFTGVFSIDVLAPGRSRKDPTLGWPQADRNAFIHGRQHDAESGRLG